MGNCFTDAAMVSSEKEYNRRERQLIKGLGRRKYSNNEGFERSLTIRGTRWENLR